VSFSWGGVGNARRTRARWIWRNRRHGVNAYRWNSLEALDETHRRRRGVLAVHACPSGAVVLQFSLDPADSSAAWPRLSASARLAFFVRSRRVSAPLRPARTGDEPVRTPRRARRQAKRVLQGDGGFPQGCDARRAAIVTVPTISVPVNDRFVPWNARSSDPQRPFPDHETTPTVIHSRRDAGGERRVQASRGRHPHHRQRRSRAHRTTKRDEPSA
jgi:hypothetical protein